MDTLELNAKYVRQQDIVPSELFEESITVIGAGAIGSCAVFGFAKTGFKKMRVFDFDKVELHNMPNQMFAAHQVGMSKVDALAEIIRYLEGFDIDTENKMFKKHDMKGTIIVAVDSMDVRKELWETAKEKMGGIRVYIDARMGAEVLRLYTILPELRTNIDKYEQTLYSSEEAEPVPCTAKSTMYTALLAGSMIVNQAKRSYMSLDKEEFEVPQFEIIYDLAQGIMITR